MATTETDKTERERFEAWWDNPGPCDEALKGVSWQAWQARADLDTGAVADKSAIVAILREHIQVDATGLAPAVVSHYVSGFEAAAEAIIAAATQPPASASAGKMYIDVERVARAIADANDEDFDETKSLHMALARAAIKAIRAMDLPCCQGGSDCDCHVVEDEWNAVADDSNRWDNLGADKQSMCRAMFLAGRKYASAGNVEPTAFQWRFRAIGETVGEWGEWREGPAPNLTSSSYEVEERPLYTAPPAQAVAADDPEWLARASVSIADMVADWGRGPAPGDGPPADLIARRLARFSPPAHPDAYRQGAEDMREKCAIEADGFARFSVERQAVATAVADAIRALPLPGDKEG